MSIRINRLKFQGVRKPCYDDPYYLQETATPTCIINALKTASDNTHGTPKEADGASYPLLYESVLSWISRICQPARKKFRTIDEIRWSLPGEYDGTPVPASHVITSGLGWEAIPM